MGLEARFDPTALVLDATSVLYQHLFLFRTSYLVFPFGLSLLLFTLYNNPNPSSLLLSQAFVQSQKPRKDMHHLQQLHHHHHHQPPMMMKKRERNKGMEKERLQVMDLSGMALDSLPKPSLDLATISKLNLSNNNLQVPSLSTFSKSLLKPNSAK